MVETRQTVQQIGLLGGSFDPPHYGHLRMALEALEYLSLERVRFIPSGVHPFKTDLRGASSQHRLEMTRLAIQHNARFELCDIESTQPNISYTIDTLKTVQRPDTALTLLIGSDLLQELHRWRRWKELSTYARIGIMKRPGHEEEGESFPKTRINRTCGEFPTPPTMKVEQRDVHGTWLKIPVTALDISATDIRRRVAAGQDVRYLTPDTVIDYIDQHDLYRDRDRDRDRKRKQFP